MAIVRARSPLASLLLAGAMVALVCLLAPSAPAPSAFLQAPPQAVNDVASTVAAGALAAGVAAPMPAMAAQEFASSVALADLSPLEDPSLSFVVLLSALSMSIALVVWGRNGF
eukprot:gb/GFBE01075851.1/.p1 GENE.gb/GFBE01075851.1/~~gb/GFBE01075851.1/.p1  ORF type:complete len:113 (+),score=25.08 gb/GFBE01075851.1/:1-339(+)